jgi:queuine/archaeosine tRNA-ribosyltransferase
VAPDFGFTLLATDGAARLGEIATAHGLVRIAALSGLHTFMNWPHPILTDSDGFQVMSLSLLQCLPFAVYCPGAPRPCGNSTTR